MQLVKKAALLAAAAGTLALLGTGTAAAYGQDDGFGGGSHRSMGAPADIDITSFISQTNNCDTSAGITESEGWLGPGGDIDLGSKCLNVIGG